MNKSEMMSRNTQKVFLGLNNIDLFALSNGGLFLLMCWAAYFDRFLHYRGRENLSEFFVYAVVILGAIAVGWRLCRGFRVPSLLLFSAQVGIILHFAGGLAILGNERLYDQIIFGIRYDKYVHLINAFVFTFLVHRMPWRQMYPARWFGDLASLVTVLGLGAVIEIVEYAVTLTVVNNGVGNYDNNMQDLIANVCGASLAVIVHRRLSASWNDGPGLPVKDD